MSIQSNNIIHNLSFKTISYHRNYDLVVAGENIITEFEGNISKLRITERKLPIIIGQYSFTMWNLKLGRNLNVNIENLLVDHTYEPIYDEFTYLVNNKHISLDLYDRVIFIQTILITKEYRKKHVVEEFIKYLYRNHYDDKILILFFTHPIQNNKLMMNYYINNMYVEIKEKYEDVEVKKIPKVEYFGINDLILNNPDTELNKIKLFGIAHRLGFECIDESSLFKLNPNKIIDRIRTK